MSTKDKFFYIIAAILIACLITFTWHVSYKYIPAPEHKDKVCEVCPEPKHKNIMCRFAEGEFNRGQDACRDIHPNGGRWYYEIIDNKIYIFCAGKDAGNKRSDYHKFYTGDCWPIR